MSYSVKPHWYTTQYCFILCQFGHFQKNKDGPEKIWNSSSACQKEISVLFQSSALFRVSVSITSSSKHRTCSQREICLLIHLGGYTLVILQSSTSSKRTQNREIFLYPDVLYAWSGNRSGPEKVMPMLTISPKYYCCSVKQTVNCREVHRIKSEIARNTD